LRKLDKCKSGNAYLTRLIITIYISHRNSLPLSDFDEELNSYAREKQKMSAQRNPSQVLYCRIYIPLILAIVVSERQHWWKTLGCFTHLRVGETTKPVLNTYNKR
jgi:hypothetical protein